MKKAIVLAAIAGFSAAASATSVKLSFSADQSQINVGETVHWKVEASFTGLTDTGYFGGFNGDFVASDHTLGTASNFENHMSFEGVPATANGANVNVNIFNAALLGSDDPTLGVFFEFDVVAEAAGELYYDASGVASLFASDNIFEQVIDFTDFPVNTDKVLILVPTPGVGGLLALGGLAAIRRRR